MTTDKKNIQALAEVCRIKGVRHIIFSPGSRSAPLVIAFAQMKEIQCQVIADERVAGFFALGLAQQLRQPVALVCTSGTAVLNLAPAICEAHHQQIPLLILTADRPSEYIGIGENQAINQTEIYKNYIKCSYTLPENFNDAANAVAQAIADTTRHYCGPVHINIPLREPLYNFAEENLETLSFSLSDPLTLPSPDPIKLSQKNMLICGMHEPNEDLRKHLQKLALRDDFVILTEPISNMPITDAIDNVDSVVAMIKESDNIVYAPDTVITIGKQIVSKRIRQYLRKVAPARHYHISTDTGEWNGMGAKSYRHVVMNDIALISAMADTKSQPSDYGPSWKELLKKAKEAQQEYSTNIPFSDWWIFSQLIKTVADGANIQYGNSSPIRYAGLYAHRKDITINANRGTSGIDGCVSTAAGAAYASTKLTLAIVGDVSFLYDSNSLWNSALSSNLRIIVINNSGGNIFGMIEGPDRVPEFEKFFRTSHHLSAEYLAQMYQIPYYFCGGMNDFDFVSEQFYKPQKGNRPAILEIKTDGALSASIYKKYFEFIKSFS